MRHTGYDAFFFVSVLQGEAGAWLRAAVFQTYIKKITMERTKVVDALRSTDFGKDITVKGWVRSHRSSKSVDFIALNDGSTINNIQVVVDPSKFDADMLKSTTTGA